MEVKYTANKQVNKCANLKYTELVIGLFIRQINVSYLYLKLFLYLPRSSVDFSVSIAEQFFYSGLHKWMIENLPHNSGNGRANSRTAAVMHHFSLCLQIKYIYVWITRSATGRTGYRAILLSAVCWREGWGYQSHNIKWKEGWSCHVHLPFDTYNTSLME